MRTIHTLTQELEVENFNNLSFNEYQEQLQQKISTFVTNNEVCNVLHSYESVFTTGIVDNGPSSMAKEIKNTGAFVHEIMASVQLQ